MSSKGPKITLFTERDFKGCSFEATRPVYQLQFKGYRNRILSVIVHSGTWVLYQSRYIGGNIYVVEEGDKINLPVDPDGTITSLKPVHVDFSEKSKCTLCENYGFSGKRVELRTGCDDLTAVNLDNRVSSVVISGGAWIGYSDRRYKGHQYLFLKGSHNCSASEGIFLNDNISSIRPISMPAAQIQQAQQTQQADSQLTQQADMQQIQQTGEQQTQQTGMQLLHQEEIQQTQEAGIQQTQQADSQLTQQADMQQIQQRGERQAQQTGMQLLHQEEIQKTQEAGIQQTQQEVIQLTQQADIQQIQQTGEQQTQKTGVQLPHQEDIQQTQEAVIQQTAEMSVQLTKQTVRKHEQKITLYTERDFKGRSIDVTKAVYHLAFKGFNGRISSVIVHRGVWVLYQESGMGGKIYVVVEGDKVNLNVDDDGTIASLKPVHIDFSEKSKCTLYEHVGFSGKSVECTKGCDNLANFHMDNRVSSLVISGGAWIGYSDRGYKGEQYLFLKGPHNCSASDGLFLSDNISSIRPILK